MTKNVPWIWFLALLLAIGLMAAGCGELSRAEGDSTGTVDEPTSSYEGALAPDPTSPTVTPDAAEAPEVESPERLIELEQRERTLDEREAELNAREERIDAQLERPATIGRADQDRPIAETGDLIPADRFRALPIDRKPHKAARESFQEVALLVPAGTSLQVEFVDFLSSEENEIGDRFVVRVLETVTIDGYFAIPAGSEMGGEVVDVEALRRIGGRALLALSFDELLTPSGEILPIRASLYDEGRSETGKDAATIGGAAVAGAVVGRAVKDKDRTKGGVLGAIIGAAVGAGIAASTEGEPIEIPAGALATLVLEEDLAVTVRVRVIES